MKTAKALLLGILSITATLAVQVQAQSFLTNGLVAYYAFNGNANDESGNGNNGTVYGATLTNDRFGNPNAAYSFDGVSNLILASSTNLPSGNADRTISVWFQASADVQENLVTLGNGLANEERFSLMYALHNVPTIAFIGQVDDTIVPTPDLVGLGWQHLVVTYSYSSGFGLGVIYLNGSQIAEFNKPNLMTDGSMPLVIGSDSTNRNDEFFNGQLDDVRVYNHALSSWEVQELYQYELTTPPTPPVITIQPQNILVNVHDTGSFSVTASGTSPLSYQWSLNATNISGATNNTLTIFNVGQHDLGVYALVVSNAFGSVTSSNVTLETYPFLATTFVGDVTIWGQNATLSVQAAGTGPLSFQWYDNGVAVLNATNQTLTLPSIQFTNAGLYSVVVSNPFGSVTNTPEQVVVNPAGMSIGMYPGVTVSGTIGYNYTIQATSDLSNTNSWVSVATVTLQESTQLWVDINANALSPANAHKFYRVIPGE